MGGKRLPISVIVTVVIIGVVLFLFLRPYIAKTIELATGEAIIGVVRNSYTVYFSEDVTHVAYPKDLIFVYGGYLVYVENNDIKNARMEHQDENPPRVDFNEVPEGETYKGGTYAKLVDKDYYMVTLKEGDSLDGLYEAVIPSYAGYIGYSFYGNVEKCDIWVKN